MRFLKTLFVLSLCLSGFAQASDASERSLAQPRAQQGLIDLRQWPLQTHGPISLRGDWMFYWQSQTSPNQQLKSVIKVPGRWENLEDLPPWRTRFGEAEYRLKILLAPSDVNVPLQLSSGFISSRFQCWYGNQLIGQSGLSLMGSPATSRQNVFSPFVPTQAALELQCRVRNQVYLNSGLIEPLILGRAVSIQHKHVYENSLKYLFLGFILCIMLYHLLLAALRFDRLLLWYGINGISNLFYYDFLYLNLLENSLGIANFSFNLLIVRLMLYLNPVLFNFYLAELFPKDYSPTWMRLNNLIQFLLVITTLLLPTALHSPSILVHGSLLMTHILFWFSVMITAARRQREGAWFFIFGMSMIMLTAINDALFTVGFQTVPGQIIYGFIVYMLSQTLFIARRYTHAWKESERLSVSLGQLAENLEARVVERTRQLTEQSERVEALSRFKESISQMFIHDLKNPLAVIIAQQTPNVQAWRRVRAAASQMQQLVLNLLDTSRFRQMGIQLNLRQHNFNELLSAALGEVEYFASQRRLEIVERIDAHYYLNCDGELVRRVLVNLLSNAIRHAPSGSPIRLEVQTEQDELCFKIRDQGPGIAPDHQTQLFEPFARFASGEINELSSSGLGLSFCKLVIDAHLGSIGLESELGQGTCVWFKVPLMSRVAVSLTQQQTDLALNSPLLSPQSKALLKPYALRLEQSEIHEISTIRLIARELQVLAQDFADLAEWRRQLILAGDTFDEQTFNHLIQTVLNTESQAATPEDPE